MAKILGYTHYRNDSDKWREFSGSPSSIAQIGPRTGSDNDFTIALKIELNSLSKDYKRSTLTVTLPCILKAAYQRMYDDEFCFELSATGPDTSSSGASYITPGTIIDSKTYSFSTPNNGSNGTSLNKAISPSPSVTFDISSIPSGTNTVYVYVYSTNNADSSTGYGIYRPEVSSVSQAADQLTKSAFKIDAITVNSNSILTPTGKFSISWTVSGGLNNTLSQYKIYYNLGSAPTTSSSVLTTTTSKSASITLNLGETSRGKVLYIGIVAIAQDSNYNSKIKTTSVCTINTKPNAPSVQQSGSKVAGSSSVTFTITKGSDSDSTQSTSIYYKINSGSLQSLGGTSLTITTLTNTSGIASGTNTIYFYTHDGLEYSTSTSKTIEVIYAPVLNSATIDYIKVNNGSNNTATLAKTGTITYNLARDVSNPTALFKIRTATTSSGLPSSYQSTSLLHSIDNSSKKIIIDILNSNSIPAGNYFEIQVAIQDSYGTSEYKTLSIGQKPNSPLGVSSINLTTDGTSRAKTNYFNNNVTISFKNPSADAARPDITSIKIYADSKEFTCSNIAEGANPSVTLDLSTISRNKTISFSVELTDAAGQKVTSNASTTLTRTSEIKFEGTEWDVNPTTFKPYTTSDNLVLVSADATTTGTDSDNIKYLYKININNTEKSLSSKKTSAEDLRNLINSIIPENARNTSYTGIITVTAVDGFDVSVSLPQKNITIDYVESPYFSKTNSIKIKHDFYTGTTNITTSTGTEVTSALAQNHATRLFNPGEGIIFMLPKATDYNNDISKYQIYISRNSLPSTSTVPLADASSATYEEAPWLVLDPNQLTVSDSDYYYYRYKASQYNQNQYYYFKLIVEDSKGNKTEARYSNTYIVGCRVTKPSFTTGAVKPVRSEDKSSITLNYNLAITDLGGSAPASGWNKNYYTSYPNIDKITLKVEICDDASFTGTNIKSSTYSSTTNLQNFTHSSMSFSGISSWSKVYMRFTIITDYSEVSSGTPASMISDPFIDSYVGNVPTVSHRSHWVGINTNSPKSGEVFVVESYSGNSQIVLRYAPTGETIVIDLVNRAMNGLNTLDGATINGGTW